MNISGQLLDEIDGPLLILFASLFVVNDTSARTGFPEEGLRALASYGLLPDRLSLLAPMALFMSNTIGNVPAVVMILEVWRGIPEGALIACSRSSTPTLLSDDVLGSRIR
jgi:Na+/H+ antiporter NhaD/arsenite permease-like protein